LRKQQTSSFTKADNKVYASNEKQVLSPEVSEKFVKLLLTWKISPTLTKLTGQQH